VSDVRHIRTTCSACPRIVETEVQQNALYTFMLRIDSVQRLFPQHSDDEREAIMGYRNGWFLCPKCWTEQIGDAEDE